MDDHRDEIERPKQWLRAIEQSPMLGRMLLAESGSLGRAAYRVARARRRAFEREDITPSIAELRLAAQHLAELTGKTLGRSTPSFLLLECSEAGLKLEARAVS
jgi:hypothetical protein